MSDTDPLGGGGGGDDDTYWSPPDHIRDLEIKLAEAIRDESEDRISENTMLLAIALVYSRESADRRRGIDMLEESLKNSGGEFQQQQMLYMLAVGYHRSEDYPTSMRYLDRCLKIAPDWEAALSLKKTVEEQYVGPMYLVALRYHQSGDYETSMASLDLCLEIAPNCEDALSLKNTIEEQRARARSFYELAVKYYKSSDYPTSTHYLDLCLQIEPNCEEALSLKKTIASEIETNSGKAQSLKKTIEERPSLGWTDIGIAVGGVAVVGGIAAVYGTGVVGGMAASMAVRRGLVYAAATASGILVAKKMAASASASSAMKN